MTTYGYARVSTADQDHASQIAALKAAGAIRIFEEKVSGKARGNRPELTKALAALKTGDVLIVTRIDRLARSTRDFLNIIHQMTEVGASFKSLREVWADTTTPHGRLMLTVLAGIAEFERELIVERTSEGRTKALSEGKRFGRPTRLSGHQQEEAIKRHADGESVVDLARSYGVHHSTISRLVSTST
ncbi:DNA invertase Pin-like site-specific DNA recombinase [Bradyrhizobium japonicum]|uniref:recombinase family protein n=1 Tax=Bradyrhizobium TaxID=374 RepID=UPI0004B9B34B|nr:MULTISPECIES: recombinase family protein [Bradyrhizobium]MDI2076506.1 recombinase family protein [Bradyrhizobium sp. Mp27]